MDIEAAISHLGLSETVIRSGSTNWMAVGILDERGLMNVRNPINQPLGDDSYQPFIVILGMSWYWVYHTTRFLLKDNPI